MSLCYVRVHCYVAPEQLTRAFLDAYGFSCRLLAGLSKRLGASVAFVDLGRVVLPPYAAFVAVAECLRREKVETVVNGDALLPGCVPVTADVLAIPWEQGSSLKTTTKEAYRTYHPGTPLLLELIPTHPAFEKKRIDPRIPVGIVELPLYEVGDPAFDLQQKELLRVAVPAQLGRYDVDEIQLRLIQQMQNCVPQIADYVYEHLEATLQSKELDQRITAFQTHAKSLQAPETAAIPDFDPSQGRELAGLLDSLCSELRSAAQEAEQATGLLQQVWTQQDIQAYLQLKPTSAGRTGVVLTNAQITPVPALNIDFQDLTGNYMGSQEVTDLHPGESRVLLEISALEGRRLVLRETQQVLEV